MYKNYLSLSKPNMTLVPKQISIPSKTYSKSPTELQPSPLLLIYTYQGYQIIMSSKPLPQTFNPPGIAPPKPTYSHVCTFTLGSTKIITVAGQIGTHEDGTIDDRLEFQVLLALENVRKCLLSTGAVPRDIMKVTQYVVSFDPANRKPSELYAKFMDGHAPPVTLIPVEKLARPGLLYEIEVMAIVAVDQER